MEQETIHMKEVRKNVVEINHSIDERIDTDLFSSVLVYPRLYFMCLMSGYLAAKKQILFGQDPHVTVHKGIKIIGWPGTEILQT